MSCPESVFGSSGGLGVERQSNNEIWREAPTVAYFIPPTDSTRRCLWHPSFMVCILGVHVFQTYKIIVRSHRLAFRLIEVTSDRATSTCTSHEGQFVNSFTMHWSHHCFKHFPYHGRCWSLPLAKHSHHLSYSVISCVSSVLSCLCSAIPCRA